jgi:phage gp36-like protein
MAYAGYADVFNRYLPITTMVGSDITQVTTFGVSSIYCLDAESYVNAYLRGRYAIPLAPEPIITQITADIAIYRLLEERAPRVPDIALTRWLNANSILCMLRDGYMLLDPNSQTIITTGGDQEVWSTNLEQAGPVFTPVETFSQWIGNNTWCNSP